MTAQSLAADNLGLVAHIVDRCRGKLDRPEALSVGNLALVKAARSWRPGGMPFTPFACERIRWALIRASKGLDADGLSEEPALPLNQAVDVSHIIDRLPPEPAEMLCWRFGIDRKPATMTQLSWKFGKSEPTIAKRLRKALDAARQVAET